MAYITNDAGPRSILIEGVKRLFARPRGDVRPAKEIKNKTTGEQILQSAERRESARRAVDTLLRRGF